MEFYKYFNFKQCINLYLFFSGRRLEDNEVIFNEYQLQLTPALGHTLYFILRKDYDKPDWAKVKLVSILNFFNYLKLVK